MPDEHSGQATEKQGPLTCDGLRNSVARSPLWKEESLSLYTARAERKYLNAGERQRALAAMQNLDFKQSLFAQLLAWSGARVSEVLALTPRSFGLETGSVVIATLKRRRPFFREVPLPPFLMQALDTAFDLRRLQSDAHFANRRLWSFSRMTAWRIIKRLMTSAGVVGPQASPKGLRHAFGVCALQSGVPVTLLQRWMGHARLSTTSIYLDVNGPDETIFAQRLWRTMPGGSLSAFTVDP